MSRSFCFLVIVALISTSCSPKKAAKFGIAATETNDNLYKVLAVHENGEQLVAMTETDSSGNITAVTGAVWFSPDGDSFVVQNGKDGLPEKIITGNFMIILSNYTSNTVDVAVVSSTGEIELVKNTPVNPDELLELRSLHSQATNADGSVKLASLASPILSNSKSLSRTLRLASFTISVAGCVVAGIFSTALTFGAALAVLAIPCGSAIVSGVQLLTEKEDDVALSSTSKALGAIACATGGADDCVALILDTTADVVSVAEEEVADREATIERAKLSIDMVGKWSLDFYWECDNEKGGNAILTFTTERFNAVPGSNGGDYYYEGEWYIVESNLTFTFEGGTEYKGTLADGKFTGTMTTSDGDTGCWSGTRISE